MNFDGLDDELDIGYTPTVASGSRSAGMKKLNRKTQTKPAPVVVNTKKNDDFDLLDDLLASPAKPVSKPTQKSKPSISITKNNTEVDSFFDEPTLPMSSKIPSKNETFPATKTVIKPIPTPQIEDTILQQNQPKNTFKFKRPQAPVTTVGIKKQQQPQIIISPSPSTRMMKPPLRKRQSKQGPPADNTLNINSKSMGGLGLVLPEDNVKSVQSLTQKQDDKFKSVNLGNKRRSSIQMNSNQMSLQLNIDQPAHKNKNQQSGASQEKLNLFKSFDNEKPKQTKPSFQYQPHKQELTLQPKKQDKKSFWQSQKSIQINQKPASPYQNSTSLAPYPQPQSHPYQTQSHSTYQPQAPSYSNQLQPSQSDPTAQLQFIKKSYQSHIDSLQKNLTQQINTNRQTRQKLIRQSNTLIENERLRMKKIHQQQIQRIKSIHDWEKKKMEDQYVYQIQGLKTQIERLSAAVQGSSQGKDRGAQGYKREVQYLEEKLRNEKKIVQDRIRLLDKRELDLEQREKQFNKRKRMQEERLRNEERRILQYQMDAKRQYIDQKRSLQQEKQQMASQLASLQIGNYKKTQDIQQLRSQFQRQQALLQKQRNDMRNINNSMSLQFRKKCQQLNMQKNKVTKLQNQLISKIRVVQNTRQRLNTTSGTAIKQNNWVNNISSSIDNTKGEQIKRAMSVQKKNQYKKLENTQNRFMEMTANIKESLNIGKKGKQFDLDNYLLSMAKYTRGREAIH